MSVIVSKHASDRVRERLGMPKKAVTRLAEQAFDKGMRRADFSGSFRRYLDATFFAERKGNNMRVYGHHLFLFQDDTLITAWIVPPKYRALAEKSRSTA